MDLDLEKIEKDTENIVNFIVDELIESDIDTKTGSEITINLGRLHAFIDLLRKEAKNCKE
jgi:hypothetical protein